MPDAPNGFMALIWSDSNYTIRLQKYSDCELSVAGPSRAKVDELAGKLEELAAGYLKPHEPLTGTATQIDHDSFALKYLVLTTEDIRRLGDLLEAQLQSLHQKAHLGVQVAVKGRTHNGPVAVLRDEAVTTARIDSVSLSYNDYASSIHLSVRLYRGNPTYNDSHFSISGTDTNWVKGVAAQVREFFQNVEQQRRFPRWQKAVSYVLLSSTAVLTELAIALLFFNTKQDHSGFDAYFLIPAILCTAAAVGSYYFLDRLSKKLFPVVELQSANPHHNTAQLQRRRAAWVISAVILPFLISLIFFIATLVAAS